MTPRTKAIALALLLFIGPVTAGAYLLTMVAYTKFQSQSNMRAVK